MFSENQSVQSEKLKAAIACLDLSLESELSLYRHRLSQETVALATLSNNESDALALHSLDSTEDSGLFSDQEPHGDMAVEEDLTLADQGIATLEVDDDDSLPESYSAELTAQPKAFDQFLDPSIDDYLQSSETLLKHLNQPAEVEPTPVDEAAVAPRRSWVVVGGMTLLILGLLALGGFLIMLALRWASIKPTPNLQSPIQPSPLPTTSPSPGVTPSLSPLPTSALTPPLPSAATEGVPSTSSPTSTPTLPVNPNASRYVVLSVANSSESLQTAQRLVPDAYLVDVGGQQRIQLASLDSLQQAQQMVDELKNQGFAATIMAAN